MIEITQNIYRYDVYSFISKSICLKYVYNCFNIDGVVLIESFFEWHWIVEKDEREVDYLGQLIIIMRTILKGIFHMSHDGLGFLVIKCNEYKLSQIITRTESYQ